MHNKGKIGFFAIAISCIFAIQSSNARAWWFDDWYDNGSDSTTAVIETVWQGDLTVSSDTELQALNGYTEINGNLEITGSVTNLASLSLLQNIKGDLTLHDTTNLQAISVFSSLTDIGGNLFIYDNDRLKTINDFNALLEIGTQLEHEGNVVITGNASLLTLDGFAKVSALHSLIITGNVNLGVVSSFAGLVEINTYYDSSLYIDICIGYEHEYNFGNEFYWGPYAYLFPPNPVNIETSYSSQLALSMASQLNINMKTELTGTFNQQFF